MKLHPSAINELIRLFQTYSGHREGWRLKKELANLDISSYDQQTTGRKILVLTRDLIEAKAKNK